MPLFNRAISAICPDGSQLPRQRFENRRPIPCDEMVELMIEASLECPTNFILRKDGKMKRPMISVVSDRIIVATMVSSTTRWPDAKSKGMKLVGELVTKTDELYQKYFGPDEYLVIDRSACMAVHPSTQMRLSASSA